MIKTLNLSILILQTVNIFVIIATQAKSNQEALDQCGILRQRNFVVFYVFVTAAKHKKCSQCRKIVQNVHNPVWVFKKFTILCECSKCSQHRANVQNVHNPVWVFKLFTAVCKCSKCSQSCVSVCSSWQSQAFLTSSCQREATNKFVQIFAKERQPTNSYKFLSGSWNENQQSLKNY